MYVKPSMLDGTGAQTLWTGDEIAIPSTSTDDRLLDFGIVPLPPGGYGATYAAHRLGLTFRGASSVDLDVLQLTMLDAYRYAELNSISVANNAALVLDDIEGRNYITASSVQTPLATSFGEPLMLYPGQLQRLYMLYEIDSASGVPITGTFSARLYYRPRRLTV